MISLTYDDGIDSHFKQVGPLLESLGMRGTFYAPVRSSLIQDPLAWRKMAGKGHEIGNHTVFHPCRSLRGKYADWLPEEFNLEHYTTEQWVDEIKTANQALWLVDGKTERTFGNTCWDNYLGPEEEPVCLEPFIQDIFLAARGENTGRLVPLDPIHYANLGTIWADRRAFGDFSSEIEELLDTGGWVIYSMHGVGKNAHKHYIEENEHLRLLQFLHDIADRVWVAPVIDVVKHLKKQKPGSQAARSSPAT